MADTADSIANTADSMADTADSIADTADSIADTADSMADTADSMADTADSMADTADSMADIADSTDDEEEVEINLRLRVRLFNLSEDGNKWCERGIGQVSACYVDKMNETFLLVNAESDGTLLLESKIEQDTAYWKQQERYIIWTEGEQILGLSFQENAGCHDVWEIICQVQGKNPYVQLESEVKEEVVEETIEEIQEQQTTNEPQPDDTQEMCFEEMLDIETVELSIYERDVLEQMIELVNRLVSPAPEDKIPAPEESQLLDLFHITEDIEETEGLQQLHETILYMLSLNRDRQ